MRIVLGVAAALLLLALAPAAEDPRLVTLKDLFFRAKAQFRGGGYAASLATLDDLGAKSPDGYGVGVLQRNPDALAMPSMAAAARPARRGSREKVARAAREAPCGPGESPRGADRRYDRRGSLVADARGLKGCLALAGALFLGVSAPLRAQSPQESALIELFAKAKAQFRGGAYAESLANLQKIDEATRAPEFAAAREKILPALSFYRGADLAALGRTAEARADFRVYLESAPATRLDPGMYPRSVIEAFEAARGERGGPDRAAKAAPVGVLSEAYAAFRPPPEADAAADESWGDGAVRFLMTKEEKAGWARLSDAASRGEFIALFWQRRDPTPATPENEYRDEMERRTRFADAHFSQGEKKGSLTDRGMVFVLMGPPSHAGSALLKIEEDPIQVARSAPRTQAVVGPSGRVATLTVTPQPMTAEKIQGVREVWHYRRDRLPRAVAANEVVFEFITKEGYGTAVLQREATALTTLEVAAAPPDGSEAAARPQ